MARFFQKHSLRLYLKMFMIDDPNLANLITLIIIKVYSELVDNHGLTIFIQNDTVIFVENYSKVDSFPLV